MIFIKSSLKLGVILFMLPFVCIAQFYNEKVEGSISLLEQNNNMIEISGFAYNKTEVSQSLRYVLSVIKTDSKNPKANKSKNNQEGRFVLESGNKKELSTTTINISEDDRTIILLLVFNGDNKVLGKDRIVLNGFEGEEDLKSLNSEASDDRDLQEEGKDGFILKGMVIQNTKTKAGNDFYDLFYSSYLAKNINGEKIVKVEEELAIGSNTQIKVIVGEDLVMQFIVNPRGQYLSVMVEHTIKRVNSYFQQQRNTKEQITRY